MKTTILMFLAGVLMVAWLVTSIAEHGGLIRIASWLQMLRKNFSALIFVSVFVGGFVYYGGSKSITFPRTDPSVAYITDAGSYVTNNAVHIAYTKLPIVPASANLIIERRQDGLTNDTDWVQHMVTTFAASPSPIDIQYANATNYDWIAYTDWTPGPTVVTNGVWHTWWAEDRQGRKTMIPIRTAVRENAETIATPKSRRNNQ